MRPALFVLLLLLAGEISARPLRQGGARPPKEEVRAVWITTVLGLDWPKTAGRAAQEEELRGIVERLSAAHFNTIFFQARGRADAFYRSRFEPWAKELTGTLGEDPGWDPLQVLVTEAHKRQMEVHAWFNTFLVRSGAKPAPSIPPHLMLSHPEWMHEVEGEWWLDPGLPAVRSYLVAVAMDLVTSYDLDGIHFDFIRYPARPFPDDAAYKRYGGSAPRDEWRRSNVNAFVRAFHDAAAAARPMLKIGSAPIGIYLNFGRTKGLQGFADLYQDARRWLREGTADYAAPQVYWSLGEKPGNPDFAAVARDWVRTSSGREIVVGIGAYKDDVFAQLPQLIDSTRAAGAAGNSFFRYEFAAKNLELGGRYRNPALIPPMPWKDAVPPNPPDRLSIAGSGPVTLRWNAPGAAPDGDGAKMYAVYRSSSSPVDIDDGDNLLAVVPGTLFTDAAPPESPIRFYAVTALDKGNNESAAATAEVPSPELIALAGSFAREDRLGEPVTSASTLFVPFDVAERENVIITVVAPGGKTAARLADGTREPGRYVAAVPVPGGGWPEGSTLLFAAGAHTERKPLRK